MNISLFLMVEGEQQVCVILLTSHTGTDLESAEAVILLCSVIRQGTDTAFHKSPTRSFVLCELSYTLVVETRPADELVCRTYILCYCRCLLLETVALYCNAVPPPDALPWLLAVLERFFAFFCPSAHMTPPTVASWGSASGQGAKQAGVSFCGSSGELTQTLGFLGQYVTEILLAGNLP